MGISLLVICEQLHLIKGRGHTMKRYIVFQTYPGWRSVVFLGAFRVVSSVMETIEAVIYTLTLGMVSIDVTLYMMGWALDKVEFRNSHHE